VLPAALSVGTHSPLVELADGGGFAGVGVVREEAAASLPAHAVEEVPGDTGPTDTVTVATEEHILSGITSHTCERVYI